MKKLILIVVVLIMAVAGTYVYWRFANSWMEDNGVITAPKKNMVYMNLKPGSTFYLDSGQLNVH